MSKRILLFPGQGSQYVGMGQKLAAERPAARALLERAEAILGFPLGKLMAEGPEEELSQTQNTQPALFTVSLMAYAVLKEREGAADYAAGHSLGEYSALCAAGVFSFEEGLKLVRLRGELMAAAGQKRPGAMAAILGLDSALLDAALASASGSGVVVAANYNSPSQIVISGEAAAVEAAENACREAGAKKVVRLPVSGAFHSPLMEYAVAGLREGLAGVDFRDAALPVITNVTAAPVVSGSELREGLLRQMVSPVRWTASMEAALGLGVTEGYEVGAGKVLMGLMRAISREVKIAPFEAPEA